MASIDICTVNNWSSYLGSWSYCQLKLLSSTSTEKIGTWKNTTGSSFTITSVTIRCATGNGSFYDSASVSGNGSAISLYLKVGSSLSSSTDTEVKTISNICQASGGSIQPAQLQEMTFTLTAPVTVANNSSITIYPKYSGSTPADNVCLCAGASKWGCATNSNNTSWIWPKVNNDGSIYIKVNGEWKPGIPYIKVNGEWKPGTAYIKQSGTWKTL